MYSRVPNIHVALLFYIGVLGRFSLLHFFHLQNKKTLLHFLVVHKFQSSRLFGTIWNSRVSIYKVTSKLFSNHHIFCLSKSYFLRCIKIMNLWLYLVMSFWVILKRDALCLQLCSVSNFSTRHVQDFTNKGYIVAICPPTQLYITEAKISAYSPSLKIVFFKFFWTI